MHSSDQSTRGVLYGVAAFSFWGLTPLYYRPLDHIGAAEILTHRIIWTLLFLIVILAVSGRFGRFLALFQSPKTLALLGLSGALIASNWFVYVWAVTHERVLEASLGYFINPLFSVVLGFIFFRERLRPGQQIAVVLAAIGVSYLLIGHGKLPWVSLVLPVSFGFYGLLRKHIVVDPLSGLLTEVLVVAPFALAYAAYLWQSGQSHFGGEGGMRVSALLILGGPITIVPLTLFAAAARRVNLSTIGFMQYIAPSTNFVLAVFLFHEAFGSAQLITFSCIWLSLIVFSLEGIRFKRIGVPKPEISGMVE